MQSMPGARRCGKPSVSTATLSPSYWQNTGSMVSHRHVSRPVRGHEHPGVWFRAVRKQQVFEIQRYLAEQMYCMPYGAGMRTAALSPSVRDFFPRSDFGVGAEVARRLWTDRRT